jgi:predicted nucleic acid-binding protein
MTSCNASDIRSYSFNAQDHLFLDANIWLSLYGQAAWARRRTPDYSRAWRDIVQRGCAVFIDVLVVSEFINAYARIEYQRLRTGQMTFKSFRKTSAFPPIAAMIAQCVTRILRRCRRLDSGFETCDINRLLNDFGQGSEDFNDQVIVEVCRTHGLKLITDDGDFKGARLDVLTANPNLLTP